MFNSLAAYPHGFVVACAWVASFAVLWLLVKLVRAALWLLFCIVLLGAAAAWVLFLFN